MYLISKSNHLDWDGRQIWQAELCQVFVFFPCLTQLLNMMLLLLGCVTCQAGTLLVHSLTLLPVQMGGPIFWKLSTFFLTEWRCFFMLPCDTLKPIYLLPCCLLLGLFNLQIEIWHKHEVHSQSLSAQFSGLAHFPSNHNISSCPSTHFVAYLRVTKAPRQTSMSWQ